MLLVLFLQTLFFRDAHHVSQTVLKPYIIALKP